MMKVLMKNKTLIKDATEKWKVILNSQQKYIIFLFTYKDYPMF